MPLLGSHLQSLYTPERPSLWTPKIVTKMTHAKPLLGYLGPESSYTQQAALQKFNPDGYRLVPQLSIQDVFQAVQSGSVATGVVPFENSTHGSVLETLDFFTSDLYPDIAVIAETYLDVHHCLLGRSTSPTISSPITSSTNGTHPASLLSDPTSLGAKPTQSLSHIKHIYSHPQGLGQCSKFVSTYLPGVQRHEVKSTSLAASLVAADATNTSVSISSFAAAKANGLDVLAEGIQDSRDNATRFFVLQNHATAPIQKDPETTGHRSKTLLSFTVDQRRPKALAEALMVFGQYGLNLTSINSRPSDTGPWDYIFFVEFQGSRFADPQGSVRDALGDLDKVTKGWRWLGSWVDDLRRRGPSPAPARE